MHIFAALRRHEVTQVAFVPDGGHATLIRAAQAELSMRAIPLTTEEEGVALLTGAWLGGARGVMLMQSSGVGNCINMFSLVAQCRTPFVAFVTMRGEWGEFNPWQVPMSRATGTVIEAMGLRVLRADDPQDVAPTAEAALSMAFEGGGANVVLLGQRLVGAKNFVSEDRQ
jgi:sulfopyruvate decarboxylase TPP-binding subunit